MKKVLLLIAFAFLFMIPFSTVLAANTDIVDEKPADLNDPTYSCSQFPGYSLSGDKCIYEQCDDYFEDPEEECRMEHFTEYTTEMRPCGQHEENGQLITDYCPTQVPIEHDEYVCEYTCNSVGYHLQNGKCVTTICAEDEKAAVENPPTYNCNQYEGYELSGDKCVKYGTANEQEANIEIKSIELVEKSDDTEIIAEPTADGLKLNFNLSFNDVTNFAKYTVTLKNNGDKDFKISDLVQPESEFVKYKFEFEDNSNVVPANGERKLTITITYENEAPVAALVGGKYVENNNLNVQIAGVSIDKEASNPPTGDNVLLYLNTMIVSAILCGTAIRIKKRIN